MTCNASNKLTLSPDNQFAFECPVFETNVKIAPCFELRDRVWRGEKLGIRRGCQAAMASNKCPINHILKRMVLTGDDPYGSKTAKLGRLSDDILKRIAPVVVIDAHMRDYGCTDRERELLIAANERASKAGTGKTFTRPRRKKAETTAHPAAPATESAAETGDMTAALNAAIEEAGKSGSDQT